MTDSSNRPTLYPHAISSCLWAGLAATYRLVADLTKTTYAEQGISIFLDRRDAHLWSQPWKTEYQKFWYFAVSVEDFSRFRNYLRSENLIIQEIKIFIMNKLFIVLLAIMLASSFAMKIRTTDEGKNKDFNNFFIYFWIFIKLYYWMKSITDFQISSMFVD